MWGVGPVLMFARKVPDLVRELGPVIKTKELLIDQDTCVQCQVCEENCPVNAIKLDDDG